MASDDLLDLARRAPDETEARWDFVEHPKIVSILNREVCKLVRSSEERADLEAEARLAIVEAVAEPRTFGTEGELVAYWNLRIRGIAGSSLRRAGSYLHQDGRVVQVEFPAGHDILGDHDDEPAHHRLLSAGPKGSTRHEGMEATLAEDRRQRHEAERRRMLEVAREFMLRYDSEVAANCFWYRVQGVTWRDVPALIGLPSGPGGREHAAILFHKFVADARRYLIEQGERVTVKILGLHADDMSVSAVLLSGREILDSFTAEYDVPEDWEGIEKVLRRLFVRGANFVAASTLPECETGVLLRTLCARRQIEIEEFDVGLLARGLPPDALTRTGLGPGLREAYLAARAKAVECELKMDAYPPCG